MDNDSVAVSKFPAFHLSMPSTPDHVRSPLRASKIANNNPLHVRCSKLAGTPTNSTPLGNAFKESTETLKSQYAELFAKYTATAMENKHMLEELAKKAELLDAISLHLVLTERDLRRLEDKHQQVVQQYTEEIECYRRSLEELERLTQGRLEQANADLLRSLVLYQTTDKKYDKLLRSYKALQSNFELEQNLRALLIDQIENLTKERDFLLSQVDTNISVSESDHDSLLFSSLKLLLGNRPRESPVNQMCTESGATSDSVHSSTSGASTSTSSPNREYNSYGNVHASDNLSSFVDLPNEEPFSASSPIKEDSYGSIDVSRNFHFPHDTRPEVPHEGFIPSSTNEPRPKLNNQPRSRQSLPTKMEALMLHHMEDNFVPSPLKLTRPNSTCLDGDFSAHNSAIESVRKRSSYQKHSRMNSLDLLPIKVEFELEVEPPRSSSSPDRNYLKHLDSVAEGENEGSLRDMAFMKLNGFNELNKRDSLLTSSSKRSSLLTEFNILSGDITKQEITKLKFELQSLKLHNEKLLSYIGFELQKQKKNIKKLSSKQRLRPSSVEYSDAKLIEKLKDILIHKRRVLRLVSINPILSTKYNNQSQMFLAGAGIGLANRNQIDERDEFEFRSLFISSLKADCDDYGFMNHQQKHNLRILSEMDQKYLHETDERIPKKYKSQTFRTDLLDGESSELLDEEDFLQIEEVDESEVGEKNCVIRRLADDWETTSEQSHSSSDVNYAQLNRFNQIKYIVLGKEHMKKLKKRKDEIIVDENLKYKFLTLVVGIVIVGFRLTSHTQQQLQGS